jgi:hypothetical protein
MLNFKVELKYWIHIPSVCVCKHSTKLQSSALKGVEGANNMN